MQRRVDQIEDGDTSNRRCIRCEDLSSEMDPLIEQQVELPSGVGWPAERSGVPKGVPRSFGRPWTPTDRLTDRQIPEIPGVS